MLRLGTAPGAGCDAPAKPERWRAPGTLRLRSRRPIGSPDGVSPEFDSIVGLTGACRWCSDISLGDSVDDIAALRSGQRRRYSLRRWWKRTPAARHRWRGVARSNGRGSSVRWSGRLFDPGLGVRFPPLLFQPDLSHIVLLEGRHGEVPHVRPLPQVTGFQIIETSGTSLLIFVRMSIHVWSRSFSSRMVAARLDISDTPKITTIH